MQVVHPRISCHLHAVLTFTHGRGKAFVVALATGSARIRVLATAVY